MGIFGGIIAGAAQGAGEAGVAVGKQMMVEDAATRLKQMEAEIQQARDDRLNGFAQELQRSGATLQQETHAVNTETDIKAAPRKIQAMTPAMVEQQSALLPGEVEKRKQFAVVDTQEKVNEFSQLEPLKRKALIDTAVEQLKALSTPEMLKAERNIALAKHIVDPSYTLIPNADGTVSTFDQRSGKSTGTVKDETGKPLIRKDPEELKAATSVINMANTNLKIAEAAFKAAQADMGLDPTAKATAAAEWKAAQSESKRVAAPAYAILYAKAGIEPLAVKTEATTIPVPKIGDVVDGNVFKGGNARDKNNWKPVSPPPAKSETGGASLYGSSGSHSGLILGGNSASIQKRISELQDRLDNNVNTTLEGKRRDETELQMILSKRNARYQGASGYDPNQPAVWNK